MKLRSPLTLIIALGLGSSAVVWGQVTIRTNGDVEIGTDTQASNLQVYGSITGMGAVPIGTVIDWWRPDAKTKVPAGFQICDGTKVTDTASPLFGQVLPDLNGRFIRGTTDPQKIGTSGGDDYAEIHITVEPAGDHTHDLPASTGGVYLGGSDLCGVNYDTCDDHQGWGDHVHLRVDGSDATKEGQHRHALGGNTKSAGVHTHAASAPPIETVPAYTSLLKIMRIR